MATYQWVGSTAGATWSVTGHWNPPGIPGGSDDAIFTSAGSTCTVGITASISTINFGGGFPSAYNKTFIIGAAAELRVIGPTMTLSNSMSFTGLGPVSSPTDATLYSSIRIPGAAGAQPSGSGTINIIANGATIHRLLIQSGGAATKNIVITGTCHISEAIANPFPSVTTNFTGDPVVCEKDIKLGYVSTYGGTGIFIWRPRAGTTGYFLANSVGEGAGQAASMAAPLIINGPGHVHFVSGLMKGGTMTYVSAASVTTSANGITGRHTLCMLTTSNFNTNTLLWDNVDYYSGNHNLISDLRVGGNFETGYNQTNIGGTGRSILLEGIKANANGVSANYVGTQAVSTLAPVRMAPGSIRVIGTGTRVFSSGTWILMDTNLVLAMSGGTIGFTGAGCPFYFVTAIGGVTSSFSNVSTNTTIENSGIVSIFDRVTSSSISSLALSIPGITISTLNKGAGTNTVINSLLYTNSVVHAGGGRYSGTAGFYTNNFTHPGGGQTIILGTTGTYTVASNFIMVGVNPTGGRAFLESDMRADFIGQVNNNSLVWTSGGTPFVGGELGMSTSYYNSPAAIPPGLATLLPTRPSVISAAFPSYAINPGVSSPIVGSFSVGKKARFFLGTGATQNVIWAATQDIDSLGPGGYLSISPQLSFNDSAGVTGPTLLRTLNWGILAPPTQPAAFTFVT